MVTISLCMIVKNEEKILARCLDSVADLMDEVIVVDTGSSDRTKEIAAAYTDRIYDFEWIDDFAAARNFAFSKASMEYIYSADADEVLSEENRERFRALKENLLPEVEIVQMKYGNQLCLGTVYNYDEEYRPKLFKRKREFVWEDPIHEAVRLMPVVYDSDIVICHMPEQNHGKRDLENFRKQTGRGVRLSGRLYDMYARELFMTGDTSDFMLARDFFRQSAADVERSPEEVTAGCLVAARAARLAGDVTDFFKYTSKVIAGEECSEVCWELGRFYEDQGDYEEAVIWYYNAAYETAPVLKKTAGERDALEGLVRCYKALHMEQEAEGYRQKLTEI